MTTRRTVQLLLALLALALVAAACTPEPDESDPPPQEGTATGGVTDVGDCIAVDMAVSSEKIDLLTGLADDFADSDEAEVDGRCVRVRPQSVASGGAMTLLSQGWPDEAADGPRPVIWSPASKAWGAILNQLLNAAGEPPMAPVDARPFMLTPLVIAMPQPMAEALGYPDEPIGFADILALARDDQGWASFGHPEWGPFKLGKTNPNFSTSGLSALIAQQYAAAGKTEGLTGEDLDRPEVQQFAEDIEQSVVHYGDTTLTFLNNLARADARGTALTYASAVAVEEVSVINYNLGNPDGVLQPGEQPVPPRIPLVAIYPEEGTLFSDNPLFVLDAEWVDADERAGAEAFTAFVQQPENQQKVLDFGFRPGNPDVAVTDPVVAANGVDPDQPQTLLEVPEPPVMVELLDRWSQQRKSARVLLVVDVSGSMGDFAGGGSRDTKLDLAKRAAISSLDQFKDDDDVGLRIFSTDITTEEPTSYVDVVPISEIGGQREELASRIEGLVPVAGTPLYEAALGSYEDLVAGFDDTRINAVVLLSDGQQDPIEALTLDDLIAQLTEGTEGQQTTPVRIFPIAYGGDADLGTLRQIADATSAAVYDASDPRSIEKVFTAVISNF